MSVLRIAGRRWQEIYVAGVLAFLFLPIGFIALFSIDKRGLSSFPITGLTTRWYRQLADDPAMVNATWTSLKVALATAVIACVLGVLASFALVRYKVRGAALFMGLLMLPIVVPALLLGVALLSFFYRADIKLSFATVVIAHVLITLPFIVLIVNARLVGVDPSLSEAAAVLGAPPLAVFRHVTLPLIRPSLVAAALLVMAISLDEFIVTFFTIGSDSTLPIVIWGQMRAGVSPTVNAVSTLLLLATTLIVLAVRRLTGVRFTR